MRLRATACGLLAAWGCAGVAAAGPEPGRPLQDLYYGDVLYRYFQHDEFGALTRLMAARAMGRAQTHAEDGELLMAGMLLAFGQTRDASAAFERLLQTETRPEPRNRAWLALARSLHQHGDDSAALAALGRIDAPLPDDLEADRQMLAAQLLIDMGRYDEAAALLRAWTGARRDWTGFAHYNLGVALIRAGRVAEGTEQLGMLDRAPASDEEQQALRDRANTALGYTQLQAQQWEPARRALQRVRLQGPSSNQALLGLGWAESGLGRDREALVPWTELAGRDARDRAVQEALLAVPYAMARAGSPNAAAQHYRSAIDIYETQIRQLAQAGAAVDQPHFVDRLLEPAATPEAKADTPAAPPGAPVAPAMQLPETVEYRQLAVLVASDRFQAGLRSCRELRFALRNLDDWKRRLEELSAAAPAAAAWPAQATRVATLRAAIEQELARQRRLLQDQAAAELGQRQQRLREYQAEARFAQARLLDRSASPPAAGTPGERP